MTSKANTLYFIRRGIILMALTDSVIDTIGWTPKEYLHVMNMLSRITTEVIPWGQSKYWFSDDRYK
jgi:hypothetical protein